jgi:hypothetical protein
MNHGFLAIFLSAQMVVAIVRAILMGARRLVKPTKAAAEALS